MLKRKKISINGIVQGVGFRPFVYRAAMELGLAGFVFNHSDGLTIEVEGKPGVLEIFSAKLKTGIPPLAQITDFSCVDIPSVGDTGFSIHKSMRHTDPVALISPDTGVCNDCVKELFDASNRRYRYPFINCVNCGPRYTIVRLIPYDRSNTSMVDFTLCRECEDEYHDPMNRRYHAQPNACPGCGPHLSLFNRDGAKITTDDPVGSMVSLLKEGNILAIRGIGGFHLAVDAQNEVVVRELRRRKGRVEKPFACMASDMDSIREFCFLSSEEEKALLHHTRPILLLPARTEGKKLAPSVAPQNCCLGFMLPYTPLHYLLLRDNFKALVMTSGNLSEEPIAIGNQEALESLRPLADYFLLHDREILQRCDDSIVRFIGKKKSVIRRSRGFVPSPVLLPSPAKVPILACGAEQKNTISIARGDLAFLSQHIGDLDNPAAFDFFKNSVRHLQEILEISPEIIAFDTHPEYLSTKWACEQMGFRQIPVQHHHAHLASVMVENGVEERCIGIILDGTGYGADGSIWGGEVLIGDFKDFERFAWLAPVPMPGGAAAIIQPWRMAVSYLYAVYSSGFLKFGLPFMRTRNRMEINVLLQMMDRKLNSPLTSACGRLFDAVSALLNIRGEVSYEAQAAIQLEMVMDGACDEIYSWVISKYCGMGPLPSLLLFQAVVEDLLKGEEKGKISARFHLTLVEIYLKATLSARESTGINMVGLSGGVFQNVFFFARFLTRLREEGFTVLTHGKVPTNDGGLALGQVAIANAFT